MDNNYMTLIMSLRQFVFRINAFDKFYQNTQKLVFNVPVWQLSNLQ